MSNQDPNQSDIENIKIILLGNGGVGKTAIINQYTIKDYRFNPNILTTYSPNFVEKHLVIEGQKIIVTVWDTAGQEKFNSVSKLFIKNAKIVILIYDITVLKSFDDLGFWYDFLKNELGQEVILGIGGNKVDLLSEEGFDEEVSEELLEKRAKEWGAEYAILSAKKDKKGIIDFFDKLIRKYMIKNKLGTKSFRKTMQIKKENFKEEKEEKKRCC